MRGHRLTPDEDYHEWFYADDMSPAIDNRPCVRCGKLPTEEGHDACLGTLPGVRFACCGHGDTNNAYVMFNGGGELRYDAAIGWFKKYKSALPAWHYSGMDGIPLWYSKIHYEVIAERFQLIEAANRTEGLAMRFCHNCECPLGVMELDDYVSKYVGTNRRCASCWNKAFDKVLEYKGMEQ